MKLRLIQLSIFTFSLSLLAGCATTQSPEELAAQQQMHTKLSAPLAFTKPVNAQQKSIYVHIQNHSDKPDFAIEEQVKAGLKEKGYRLVRTADKASYVLDANIVMIQKNNSVPANDAFAQGYQAIDNTDMPAANQMANAEEKSNDWFGKKYAQYSIVTDVQISMRDKETGHEIKKANTTATTASGKPRNPKDYSDVQAYMSISHWKRMQTRLSSTVQKTDENFADAKNKLEAQLAEDLVGLF